MSGHRHNINVRFDHTHKLPLLFDTGATVTIITQASFKVAQAAGAVVSKCPGAGIQLATASGSPLTVQGVYMIRTQIATTTMVVPFVVSGNLAGKAGIMGMNLIKAFRLGMDPEKGLYMRTERGRDQHVDRVELEVATVQPQRRGMTAKFTQAVGIQAQTARLIRFRVADEDEVPVANQEVLCEVAGVSLLVHTDGDGAARAYVPNASNELMQFRRGEVLATCELFADVAQFMPTDARVSEVSEARNKPTVGQKVFPVDPKLVDKAIDSALTGSERQSFKQLIHQYADIISTDKHDLGLADIIEHDVELADNTPVYTQQYRLPTEQLNLVKEHLAAWIRSGIVERSNSKYNSPVFCVPKKEGHGLRVVLDYRKLNAKSLPDKYSIKSVEQCLEEVGEAGSTWFSCIDLRSGFWQLKLAKSARHLTAFTIPGVGQFQYCVAPMGLAGSPASFSRLMDLVMQDLANVITYIDDCLIHSRSAKSHLGHLNQAMTRLRKHGLKINLEKCIFGTRKIQYLGHSISGAGVSPGLDKTGAVANAQPPRDVKQVRSFVGLCNYFRGFINNFARVAAPLFKLTRNDTEWEGGELPKDAKDAFLTLRRSITASPILAFPTREGQFILYTDAALGDADVEGGLGAVLMQEQNGTEKVLAYASRRLIQHERNYPAFLLEMQAATWACEHFAVQLNGRRFIIRTDHMPLCKLGTVHTRTFNRLQMKMLEMFPDIQHVKGQDNPVADFLSRYAGLGDMANRKRANKTEQTAEPIGSVDLSPFRIIHLQAQDETLRKFKATLERSNDPTRPQRLTGIVRPVALVDGVLLAQVPERTGFLGAGDQLRILTPVPLRQELIMEAHEGTVAGHGGIHRTAERLKSTFYWPQMERDIQAHIAGCAPCQATSTKGQQPHAPLQPIKVPNGPNERVHIDLFGPVKGPQGEKEFVLVMTDAFSKLVALQAIPTKEPSVVATAFLNSWVYKYGSPKTIVSDQGQEFVAQFAKAIWTALDIEHRVTTPYHPQTNAQAEVFNKTLAAYLRACIYERKDKTTSWKDYLPPLAFSHNTATHRSAKMSPFAIMHGYNPRVPMWQDPGFLKELGNTQADLANADAYAKLQQTQQTARKIVYNNLQQAQTEQKKYFDLKNKVKLPEFKANDLVWSQIMQTTDPNRKLAPKYEKAVVLERMTLATYRIRRERTGRGRKVGTVNAYHLKPRTQEQDQAPEAAPQPQPQQEPRAGPSTENADAVGNPNRKWTPQEAAQAFLSGQITQWTGELYIALMKAGYRFTQGGGGGGGPPPGFQPHGIQLQAQQQQQQQHEQQQQAHLEAQQEARLQHDFDEREKQHARQQVFPTPQEQHTSFTRGTGTRGPLRQPLTSQEARPSQARPSTGPSTAGPSPMEVDQTTGKDKKTLSFTMRPPSFIPKLAAKMPTARALFGLKPYMKSGPNDPSSSDLGVRVMDRDVMAGKRWTRSMFRKNTDGVDEVVIADGPAYDLSSPILFLETGQYGAIGQEC